MRAIFLKELRDGRGVLLLLLAILLALAVVPRDLGRMWTGFNSFLVVPMIICWLGARLVAAETEDDQLSLLLTVPIARWRLFAAKVGAGLTMATAIGIVAALGIAAFGTSPLEPKEACLGVAVMVVLYGLGAFFSLVWQGAQGASSCAFLVFVVGMTSFASASRAVRVRGTWESGTALLIGLAVLILSGTAWAFCRADLTDVRERRRTALSAGAVIVAGALATIGCYLSFASR